MAYATAKEPDSVIAIDRTHSGHLDLVVGESWGAGTPSELFVNDGHGAFTASPDGASGNNVGTMVAADFNGDGRVDLASQSNGSVMDVGTDGGAIGIDFGTTTGSFGSQLVTYPTPRTTGYLATGDFNGDGHPDLAFAGFDYTESGGGGLPAPEPTDMALSVYFNAGDGTFGEPVAYANPDYFQSTATGDFDGDGHTDIVELTSVSEGGFDVFFNAGDGTFRSKVTVVASTSWIAYGLGVADFNGDGKDDIATTTILNSNQQDQAIVLEVFTGNGNGTFDGPAMYPIVDVASPSQVVVGDFNGDGKPDIAMVIGSSTTMEPIPVSVFENQGDGTFAAPVIYTVGGQPFEYPTALAAGDFNGDGVTDLAGWRRERLASPWDVRPIDVVPDWICEIISTSNAGHDRVTKRELYARHGVTNYWLADPSAGTLETLRLDEQSKRRVDAGAFDASARARIPPFEAIELDLSRVFPPPIAG